MPVVCLSVCETKQTTCTLVDIDWTFYLFPCKKEKRGHALRAVDGGILDSLPDTWRRPLLSCHTGCRVGRPCLLPGCWPSFPGWWRHPPSLAPRTRDYNSSKTDGDLVWQIKYQYFFVDKEVAIHWRTHCPPCDSISHWLTSMSVTKLVTNCIIKSRLYQSYLRRWGWEEARRQAL